MPVVEGGAPIGGPLASLSAEALRRVIVSIAAEERARISGCKNEPAIWAGWNDDTRFDEDGAGFDSLAKLHLISRVSEFFHLHEAGIEDYLLVRPSLGEWVALIGEAGRMAGNRVTFRSSGSTGTPSTQTHEVRTLVEEVAAHAALLPGVTRIVSLVPPHHIYGFLFSVLGPCLAARPVFDARLTAPPGLVRRLRPGDAVVATPFLWDLALSSGLAWPEAVLGITSGAPAPRAIWHRAAAAGLDRFVEVFGSSETAGLGWRSRAEDPFALFDNLCWRAEDPHPRRGVDYVEPPDHLERVGPRSFVPKGRRDGVVQVGGVNVLPTKVAAWLCAFDGVADATVRLSHDAADARLKAFVVPGQGVSAQDLDIRIRARMQDDLSPPERPVRIDFGAALPRNAVGKLVDWE